MKTLLAPFVLVALLVTSAGPAAASRSPAAFPAAVTDPPPIAGTIQVGSVAVGTLPDPPRSFPGLDSALSQVADAAGRSPAAGLDVARAAGLRIVGGKVMVRMSVQPRELQTVRTLVHRVGGDITGVHGDGRFVEAIVPAGVLRRLGRESGILRIERPKDVEPAFGVQNTQGDSPLNGPAWRSSGNVGAGVKLGIIDVGFSGYPALLGTDLPSSVTVKNFVTGQTDSQVNGTTKHGTACAEIVHDVAPGAQLYFAKVATGDDIFEAADWMEAQGVRIVSSSIGTWNVSPGDGTGLLEDLVAEKRAAGITWFTAASNDRQAHWGGAANISGGTHFYGPSQNVNYFTLGGGAAAISAGFSFTVYLRWSDWTAPVDQDYDIRLVRLNPSTLAWETMAQVGGFDVQDGKAGQTPTETARGTTSGAATAYGFVIQRVAGTDPVNLEVFAPKVTPLQRLVHERSLSNLADVNSAVTVAAVDVASFSQEPYSSEGPTNGPGGIATGGNLKPDISAFANVNTVSYGTGTGKFNGTSAATPHVAAAAALALGANPTLTPNQLEAFLTGRAVDQGSAGPDTDFGHGRVSLGAAPPGSDTTPPTLTAPNADFRTAVNVGTGSTPIKLRVSFTATDPTLISRTRLEQKVGTAAYANVSLATHTSVTRDLSVPTSGTTPRRFRARATDFALNTSPFATGGAFRVRAFQNGAAAIVQSGSWSTQSNSSFYGGSVRHTTVAGRRQTLTASVQDVAIVTTKGPNRGIAKVFVDGVEVATIDLYSATTQYRQVVWSASFASAGTHTIEWRVTGSKRQASTGTRVDLDAFLVMQP